MSEFLGHFLGDWNALLVLLIAGFLPNEVWRMLGLALFPLASMLHTGVDILISGVSAGTIAFGAHWWRRRE